MTSSQYDPRPGFDDSIGGDVREDSSRAVDMVDQIFEFNEKIIGIPDVEFNPLDPATVEWTRKAFLEETREFVEGAQAQDIVSMVDAALDLVYFAIGTLKKMGLTKEHVRKCMTAVHTANMTKVRGKKESRGNHEDDAIKPTGWVSPEDAISQILFLE